MKTLRNQISVINKNDCIIFENNNIIVIKEQNNKLFFNIINDGNYIETYNVAEATALLIKNNYYDDNILNIKISKIDKNIDSTYSTLLWLTGGLKTWEQLNLDWLDYYNYLDYEFGYQIKHIVKISSTIGDIKRLFIETLSLDKIYNTILKYSI